MKKFILGVFGKNNLRMAWMIFPAFIIGLFLFPVVVPPTFGNFMITVILLNIWSDIMDIKEKLK